MRPGGGTLGIFGWGCAAGTLEPLAYTRASSAEFYYPMNICHTYCVGESKPSFWHLLAKPREFG